MKKKCPNCHSLETKRNNEDTIYIQITPFLKIKA